MRPEHYFRPGIANGMQRQDPPPGKETGAGLFKRGFHRALVMTAFIIIGIVSSTGTGSTGPMIVKTEDTGGPAAGSHLTVNQRTAARIFNEVFVQQKPDVCALLMTATAVTHTPVGKFEGPAGFEQYVAEVWATYPSATFGIDDSVVDGDLVRLRWTIAGEQVAGIAILRFEQHMIAEMWIEYGSAALADPGEPYVVPERCPPCREP